MTRSVLPVERPRAGLERSRLLRASRRPSWLRRCRPRYGPAEIQAQQARRATRGPAWCPADRTVPRRSARDRDRRGVSGRDRAALDAAARGDQIVEASLTEPRGMMRFSRPTGLVKAIMPIVPDFLRLYPRVRLRLIATDRPVDLIGDRIDVALRVRVKIDSEASLTLQTLGRSRRFWLRARRSRTSSTTSQPSRPSRRLRRAMRVWSSAGRFEVRTDGQKR